MVCHYEVAVMVCYAGCPRNVYGNGPKISIAILSLGCNGMSC